MTSKPGEPVISPTLNTPATIGKSIDSVYCGICRRQLSQYTCPKCLTPYCSLSCYKNPKHFNGNCTQDFYRRELELEIKNEDKNSKAKREERDRMMEILKRFEEANPDEFDEDGDADSGEDDADSLTNRFATVDIHKASAEEIWETLTSEERKAFLHTVSSSDSAAVDKLLAQVSPWWIALGNDAETTAQELRLPTMLSPETLRTPTTQATVSRPNLIYNLVSLTIAYAHTVRFASTSLPLAESTDSARRQAVDLLRSLVAFLFDRASKQVYASLQEALVEFWSRLSEIPSSYSHTLLTDALMILKPPLISSPDDSIHQNLLLALSDMHDTLLSCKLKLPAKKVQFYFAHVSQSAFMGDAMRYVVAEIEAELHSVRDNESEEQVESHIT